MTPPADEMALAKRLHRFELFREYPHLNTSDPINTSRVQVDWEVTSERWFALAALVAPALKLPVTYNDYIFDPKHEYVSVREDQWLAHVAAIRAVKGEE